MLQVDLQPFTFSQTSLVLCALILDIGNKEEM
jgi:hypothetical protein